MKQRIETVCADCGKRWMRYPGVSKICPACGSWNCASVVRAYRSHP